MSRLINSHLPVTEASIDELIKTEQKKANVHFKKMNRANNLATVILWTAAGLTLAILIYILGFIIYKGFRSDNVIESGIINTAAAETPTDWYDGDSILIVNKKIRLKEITITDLNSLLEGKPSNWGNINEQDLKVYPFVLHSVKGETGKNTTLKNTAAEIASAVEKQEGAMGLIPANQAGQIKDYNVKIIPVQPLSIAVNPSVLEIRDNRKLRYIDRDMMKNILAGNVSNWQQVNGINLPLRLVIPPAGSYEYKAFLKLSGLTAETLPKTGIKSGNSSDYIEKIRDYPGSVGLMLSTVAATHDMTMLNYQFRKTGRNLQLWFLFEEPRRAGRVGGISSIVINTVYMVLLTVLFSTPLGIGAAIYLTEYASQGRMVKILRLGTETLAGIPSIIFGLFGFIVFVGYMHLGIGLLSGTLTLTLMILPTIVRTSEEAIKAVPRSFRAGSLALGAGKWQTIYKVVIPAAAPGILTGVILAIGRAVGETAALLFTMGFDYNRVKNLSTSARVLSTHLYQLVKEGISFDRAFATATILIVIVLFVNVVSTKLVVRKY